LIPILLIHSLSCFSVSFSIIRCLCYIISSAMEVCTNLSMDVLWPILQSTPCSVICQHTSFATWFDGARSSQPPASSCAVCTVSRHESDDAVSSLCLHILHSSKHLTAGIWVQELETSSAAFCTGVLSATTKIFRHYIFLKKKTHVNSV